MSKKPILLIIIFLFKKQICSEIPKANNPSYQPLASDAKNKSQYEFISKEKLLERKKTIENSNTNKRKLEKEPKIETASEESKNSQFDDIAYLINSNFPEKFLDDLYENCKKSKSEPQEIIVIGDNMDVEKDNTSNEYLKPNTNLKKEYEIPNHIRYTNTNVENNQNMRQSINNNTNSLSGQTKHPNMIEINLAQSILLTEINIIEIYKTSEAINTLLTKQRNYNIKKTTNKLNNSINLTINEFITNLEIQAIFFRKDKINEMLHIQNQFNQKTYKVQFLSKNIELVQENIDIYKIFNNSSLTEQNIKHPINPIENIEHQRVDFYKDKTNSDPDASQKLEVDNIEIYNCDFIKTYDFHNMELYLKNYTLDKKSFFTIEKNVLFENLCFFEDYMKNYQNFDYNFLELIIGKNECIKFILSICNLIVPNNAEAHKNINAPFLNLNDDLKSHKIAEMEIIFKEKLNHEKTIEITNDQLQILKNTLSSIIELNIGSLMVLFPDILEGSIYIEKLIYENSYKISEYDLINYLYILFVFKNLISIDLFDKIPQSVGKNQKGFSKKEYLTKTLNFFLHTRIMFIQLMVPFVKKKVVIDYLELIYVFYLENQRYQGHTRIEKKYCINDKVVLISFYFFEFQSFTKIYQNYEYKQYPFLIYYISSLISDPSKFQIKFDHKPIENNDIILKIISKILCRDYFLQNNKSIRFLVLFQLLLSYPNEFVLTESHLCYSGRTALKQSYRSFYDIYYN
ncbi:hypothetical protein GVAV_000399 [Gurleya vavrai]